MNPSQILNMMMQNNPNYKNNPMAQNALNMLQSGNANGLEEMARNLAKTRGVDIDALRKQIGI